MKYSLTNEDREYILANRPRLKVKELAAKFNVPAGTIKSVCRRAKEVKLSGKWKTADHSAVIATYTNEGLSKTETGKKHSLNETAVTAILKYNNIPIRDLIDSHKQYSLNVETFKDIDTQEKAYWLGFLYADGYVHKDRAEVKLQLAAKDHGHLIKYQKFLQSDIPIKQGQQTPGSHPSFRLTVCNRKFTNHLIAKGCTQAKSFTTTFPTWLNEELIPAFLLGLMDGDGCVQISKNKRKCSVQFLGTVEIVQPIHDYLLKKGIIKTPKRVAFDTRCPKIYTVNLHANADIYELYHFLYSQSPVWLDRKKAKFEEFFKHRESLKRCENKA